ANGSEDLPASSAGFHREGAGPLRKGEITRRQAEFSGSLRSKVRAGLRGRGSFGGKLMRTWKIVLSAGVLAGLALVTACGSDDGDAAPPGPDHPDVAAYCNARARAECSEQAVSNCAAPSVEACVAKRQM